MRVRRATHQGALCHIIRSALPKMESLQEEQRGTKQHWPTGEKPLMTQEQLACFAQGYSYERHVRGLARQQWMDLIIAEKKRQMHLPEDLWPPWPPRSSVSDVMTMPMVMWLSKAPKETRKRKREGQTCPAPPAPSHPPPPPAPCHAGYANYYIMNTSGFGMSR